MSHFSQVQDLLLHNQQLHARTATYYGEFSAESDDERVKMFLKTLVNPFVSHFEKQDSL
ncbi:hypothetical protein [Paraglaciecola sp. MB-3u-78]|uniref:hypothetical protein n=1 Tax=Paraglaciecola sp. MB-3u-78 TaxID=2058332 RepID=UPI0012FF3525|nr:hypothetical protein [Paraglaciecola sp. MB-3u-78]